jgi:hypothetical protein
MPFQVFDYHALFGKTFSWTSSSTLLPQLLATAPDNGLAIDSMVGTNDDGVGHVVSFIVTVGSITVQLGAVSVPIGAGFDGTTPSADVLSGLPLNNNRVMLPAGATLSARIDAVPAVGFTVNVTLQGGSF